MYFFNFIKPFTFNYETRVQLNAVLAVKKTVDDEDRNVVCPAGPFGTDMAIV